jgi:hypothetical protein
MASSLGQIRHLVAMRHKVSRHPRILRLQGRCPARLQEPSMFNLLSTFIATFAALCKGLLVLAGVLLGAVAFVLLLGSLLAAGVIGLIEAWRGAPAQGAQA